MCCRFEYKFKYKRSNYNGIYQSHVRNCIKIRTSLLKFIMNKVT